jgi:hypothetical protein
MKTQSFQGCALMLIIGFCLADRCSAIGPFDNTVDSIPSGWNGPVFQMSKDYPTNLPPPETCPWTQFDFKTQPSQYIGAVLNYVLEGNVEVAWKVQDNAVRKWYTAPGMLSKNNGREFVHGLTRERPTPPNELGPGQTAPLSNWAIGFYNAPGGYVLGQVWKNPLRPDPSKGLFPEGTVSFKLLFTTGTPEQLPFLDGAPEFQANINRDGHPVTVRLLQIDVAIRDTRNDNLTGWVFGTFVYQASASGADPWRKVVPVGLMWGNDPDLTPNAYAGGRRVTESWINPNVRLPHVGWLGRLNGPVDNPISSCLSCHSLAAYPQPTALVFSDSDPLSVKMAFFQNIPAGSTAAATGKPLDYSLQLGFGLRTFPGSLNPSVFRVQSTERDDIIPRAGNPSSGPSPVKPLLRFNHK